MVEADADGKSEINLPFDVEDDVANYVADDLCIDGFSSHVVTYPESMFFGLIKRKGRLYVNWRY